MESLPTPLDNLVTEEYDDHDDQLDDLREAIEASDIEVGERMIIAAQLSKRMPSTTQLLSSFRTRNGSASSRIDNTPSRRQEPKTTFPADAKPTASLPSTPVAKRSRLQALCMELVQTEKRYHRDLALLVQTFVHGLRAVHPELIHELTPNCEQLLELHSGLCDQMVAAAATKSDEALASALGSELLRVSPFFTMYVSYCAHFMRGNELLEKAHKSNPMLSKAIADAEAHIQRRNIVERGENAPVSIFAFLIKPVQRLCQFPLLFKEIVKAMSPPTNRKFEPPKPGTARNAAFCPREGKEKAEYVLAVLEDVAQLVNDRVWLRERELRLLEELDTSRLQLGNPSQTSDIAIMGPTAALKMELRARIDLHSSTLAAKRNSMKNGSQSKSSKVLANITDGIGLRRSQQGDGRCKLRMGEDCAQRLSKLYILADSVICADPATTGGTFNVLAHWPLRLVHARVVIDNEADESVAEPPSGHLEIRNGREILTCWCDLKDASEVSTLIAKLQSDLAALSNRRNLGGGANAEQDTSRTSIPEPTGAGASTSKLSSRCSLSTSPHDSLSMRTTSSWARVWRSLGTMRAMGES